MKQPLLKRRELSSVFIFDKFPGEEKAKPTCVEDCQMETRLVWMRTKNIEYLKKLVDILGNVEYELMKLLNKNEIEQLNLVIETYSPNSTKNAVMGIVNRKCKNITTIADKFGIVAQRATI